MAQKTSAAVNGTQSISVPLVDGRELKFKVARDHYSNFLDDASDPQTSNLSGMQNLLMRSGDEPTKEILRELVGNPANVTALAGGVLKQYKPDIEIAVKL